METQTNDAVITPYRHLRPRTLWTQKVPTPSVTRYFDAHRGEFYTGFIESGYRYAGTPSRYFSRILKINPDAGYHRFEGKGAWGWSLKANRIRNPITADLFAAADWLGGIPTSRSASGPARGYGLDVENVWVALLDGGVGVELHMAQDEYTNRMQGWQRTTIRGPLAYRALTELLNLDWCHSKLQGETARPLHEDIIRLVDDLVLARVTQERHAPPPENRDHGCSSVPIT